MIKAEIITHEGNPGPNWLDRCKTVVTPANAIIATVVVVAVFVVVYANAPKDVGRADRLPATSRSIQSATRTPLTIAQPVSDSSVQPSSTGSVQASGNATAISAPVTSGVVGAPSTPSFNTARNQSSTSSSSPQTTDPNTVTAKTLTQGVQSTVTKTTEASRKTVTKAVDTVRSIAPGLGL